MKEKLKYAFYITLVSSFFAYSLVIYKLPVKTRVDQADGLLAGKAVWQKKNCGACHQLYGLGGFLGPDITNVYLTEGKGPGYIAAFLRAGTPVMPAFNLTDTELNNLLLFLQHVAGSGKSDPRIFKRNLDGTIEFK